MTVETPGAGSALTSEVSDVHGEAAGAGAPTSPESNTTTVRIFSRTKPLVRAHAREGESTGQTIDRVLSTVPTDTQVDRDRRRIAAYIRDQLIPDFGDRDEAAEGEALWRELAMLQHPGDPDTVHPTAVILDNTALTTLATTTPAAHHNAPADPQMASTRRLLAQLLYTRPAQHDRQVVAPTQAVHVATLQQPDVARHVLDMEVFEAAPFTLEAVLLVGRRVSPTVNGAVLHVVHTALPSEKHPTGRPVITAVPDMYQSYREFVKLRPVSVTSSQVRPW